MSTDQDGEYRLLRTRIQTLLFYLRGPFGPISASVLILVLVASLLLSGLVSVPGLNTIRGVGLVVGAEPITYPAVPKGYDVGQLLTREGVSTAGDDTVDPEPGTKITSGMVIKVTRISFETRTEKETIPQPKTLFARNNDLQPGEKKVTRNGKAGTAEVTYQVKVVNGKDADKKQVSRKVISEPVAEVVNIGPGVVPGEKVNVFSLQCDAGALVEFTINGAAEVSLALSTGPSWTGTKVINEKTTIKTGNRVDVTWSGKTYKWKSSDGICRE